MTSIKVDGYPHTEVAADSAVHCGSLCTSATTCSSFFFLATTGRCLLNEFVFVKPDGGQSAPGARYFKPNSPACPYSDGYVWLRGQCTCFKIYTTTKNFTTAYTTCASVGSRLAIMDTKPKFTAFVTYMADSNITISAPFLGAAREGVLDGSRTTWDNILHPLYWLNGVKVATSGPDSNWYGKNPDNGNGVEACLNIYLSKWNDVSCGVYRGFFCEKVLPCV
ncbi:uncharacterized protein LOC112575664 [Pomacea canaliculata]|uniref:uncharacterized protein LOC112575664 n=1 Tax=Pomacea canaliculata TaxID=400727 RepID=UPI000D72D2E1|nr:uncharacterized protein LOC112575664 [Pomacea canaliculata]